MDSSRCQRLECGEFDLHGLRGSFLQLPSDSGPSFLFSTDLAMNEKQPSRPSGKLAHELEHCGDLAARYFSFLGEADPLERWENVAPLTEPITIEKQYPVDWDLVRQLAAVCPSLTRVASAVETHDAIAPSLGLRYAWSRFCLHARLLNAIDQTAFQDAAHTSHHLRPYAQQSLTGTV